MRQLNILTGIFVLLFVMACSGTPTPTPKPPPTSVPVATASPTAVPSAAPTVSSTPTPKPSVTSLPVFTLDPNSQAPNYPVSPVDGLGYSYFGFSTITFDGSQVAVTFPARDEAGPVGCSLIDWVDRTDPARPYPGVRIAQRGTFSLGNIIQLYGPLASAPGTHLHVLYAYCGYLNIGGLISSYRYTATVTQ